MWAPKLPEVLEDKTTPPSCAQPHLFQTEGGGNSAPTPPAVSERRGSEYFLLALLELEHDKHGACQQFGLSVLPGAARHTHFKQCALLPALRMSGCARGWLCHHKVFQVLLVGLQGGSG